MCQLFGVRSDREVDIEFSFREWKHSGEDNPHGHNFAWWEGGQLRLVREASSLSRAADGDTTKVTAARSRIFLCHVRLRSVGPQDGSNTHPFVAEFHGKGRARVSQPHRKHRRLQGRIVSQRIAHRDLLFGRLPGCFAEKVPTGRGGPTTKKPPPCIRSAGFVRTLRCSGRRPEPHPRFAREGTLGVRPRLPDPASGRVTPDARVSTPRIPKGHSRVEVRGRGGARGRVGRARSAARSRARLGEPVPRKARARPPTLHSAHSPNSSSRASQAPASGRGRQLEASTPRLASRARLPWVPRRPRNRASRRTPMSPNS